MKKLRYDKIRKQVTDLGPKESQLILMSLVDCLWGAESDQEWGADTLEAIANLLHESGLGPYCLD